MCCLKRPSSSFHKWKRVLHQPKNVPELVPVIFLLSSLGTLCRNFSQIHCKFTASSLIRFFCMDTRNQSTFMYQKGGCFTSSITDITNLVTSRKDVDQCSIAHRGTVLTLAACSSRCSSLLLTIECNISLLIFW